MPNRNFPFLETGRLGLRALTLEASAAIFQDLSDAEVAKFLVKPYTNLYEVKNLVQALIDEYQQGIGLTWVLALKETQAFAGRRTHSQISLRFCGLAVKFCSSTSFTKPNTVSLNTSC